MDVTNRGSSLKWLGVGGLFACLAIAVAAFAAPSAMGAAVLCETSKEPCPSEDVISPTTPLVFELEPETAATLPLAEHPCFESSLKLVGIELEEWTGNIIGQISGLTFGECWPGCVDTATGLPWATKLESNSQTGRLDIFEAPVIKGTCEGVTCVYGVFGSGAIFLTGGNPATIPLEMTLAKMSGICGAKTSSWKGKYQLVSPATPLFFSAS